MIWLQKIVLENEKEDKEHAKIKEPDAIEVGMQRAPVHWVGNDAANVND